MSTDLWTGGKSFERVCVCVTIWKITEVLCPFVEGHLCFHWHMGFHMVNVCLTSQETANCFPKQPWSLLIISMASQFRLSIFPSLVTPPCKILSVSLLKGWRTNSLVSQVLHPLATLSWVSSYLSLVLTLTPDTVSVFFLAYFVLLTLKHTYATYPLTFPAWFVLAFIVSAHTWPSLGRYPSFTQLE